MMCQKFSTDERSGLQAGQFSTRTLLLWRYTVVIAAVCGFALSCWNTRHPEWSICCSKTFIYISAFRLPSDYLPKHASYPYRIHVCTPIPSEVLAFELNADDTLEGLILFYPGGHGIHDFQQECQIWTRLTIEHFSTLKQDKTELLDHVHIWLPFCMIEL